MKKTTIKTAAMAIAAAVAMQHQANAQCISGNCEDGYGVYQNETLRYTGFFDDGLPNGYGILTSTSGQTYIGEFKDMKYHGKGTLYFKDNERYVGYWENGKRNGPGIQVYTDGKSDEVVLKDDQYDKKFEKNEKKALTGCLYGNDKNGFNVTYYKNGDRYEGYNNNGKHHGYGKLVFNNGHTYEGQFSEGQFDGYGILTKPDGSVQEGIWEVGRYEGEIKNHQGCLSGNCKNEFSVLVENGKQYIGQFKSGKPNGIGKYVLPNGDVYKGSVLYGEIEGYGTIDYAKSDAPDSKVRYVGDVKKGLPHGYGAMLFNNGHIYYGQFKNGEFDGQGIYEDLGNEEQKIAIYEKGKAVKDIPALDPIYGSPNETGIILTVNGKYTGELMDGMPTGHGMLECYDGSVILGEFDEGKANGHCIYENKDKGIRYVGAMKNNKITGRGTMEYTYGSSVKGYFRDGVISKEDVDQSVPKPQVSWLSLPTINSETDAPSMTVKIGVTSDKRVKDVRIYNNDKEVGHAIGSSGMGNLYLEYNFQITLNPGRNTLTVKASNDGGTTISENRIVDLVASDQISKQRRIALIVGNNDYEHVSKLRNAVNDAKLMTDVLTKLGFECMTYYNASRTTLKDAALDFGDKLAEEKTVGLFFYAGHAIQIGGVNYMIPVEAPIPQPKDVESVCFSLNKIMGQMQYAANDMNIIILDACRDNPFADDGSQGLVPLDAPKGSFIAYSTSPGKTAYDGDGQNGLYTEQLAKALMHQGAKLEEISKEVRSEVYRISHESKGAGREQIPWENSSVFGNFYFIR
ncbi:MAG: caspase family protein [Bacteroidales bacterium]|nr:caspase family protein [Bacteroidales bacterium]